MKSLAISNMTLSAAFLGLGLAILATPIAHADTFDVDTPADLPDDGSSQTACHTSADSCSLRAAIMKANRVAGTSIVNVPAGTYVLTIPPSGSDSDETGDLNITNSVAIIGQGAGRTIIDANQIDRVLDISLGQFVELSDLTIRNGFKMGANGGGIYNEGITTITGCVIENNNTHADGITGNGAGIFSTGSLDVIGSTIASNHVVGPGDGGGIDALGPAVIRDSTIYRNIARDGGGVIATDSSQYLYVVNSTISENAAYNNGGGIHSVDGPSSTNVVALYSTSVIGNDASSDSDAIGQGGGVYAADFNGARFLVVNTLIANNTINNRGAFDDCVGLVEAYGYNLFSKAVPPLCAIGGNGSAAWGQVSLETIGSLQDNGGPTRTHALLQNNEGIDSTTNQGCIDQNGTLLTTDQRGLLRVAGARCDVGAFEFGSVVDAIFADSFE